MTTAAPRWLTQAGKYLGTREVPGVGSHPTIMGWATRAGGWIASFFIDDDVPWCALFVNAVLFECGVKGTNSLAARSFLTWGRQLLGPRLGCLLVFTRDGGGHVGFYLGETRDAYRVRGGNQGNAVSDIWIAKSRLAPGGMRWPHHEDLPPAMPVLLAATGEPHSENEV